MSCKHDDATAALLVMQFAGQTLSVRELYERHSNRTPFVLKNYKSVLVRMEASGKITAIPPKSERPAVKGVPTMAYHVRVTFQSR